MGWSYRKSVNFGPVRVNASKSGLGTSFGFPGLRIGVSPDGKRYLRLGIPGTGFCWIKYF